MPYIMTVLSLFTADSIIKQLIEKKEVIDNNRLGAKGRIILKKYHNEGAMLNLGSTNQQFVALLSLVFSAFVTGMFVVTLGMRGKALLNTGLALILGGAYSNTYDRLKRKYVVDYLSFDIGDRKCRCRLFQKLADKFGAVVFNLSDFGIIIGAMLLVISQMKTR